MVLQHGHFSEQGGAKGAFVPQLAPREPGETDLPVSLFARIMAALAQTPLLLSGR